MVDLANPYAKKLRESGGAIVPMGPVAAGQALRRSASGLLIEGYAPAAGVSGIWLPDAAPASPHADDQEFNGAWPPTGWAEYDQNNLSVPTQADGFLQLTNISNATVQSRGVYRACPPEAEWSIWCKVSMSAPDVPTTGLLGCGLFLAADIVGAPTTAKLAMVELGNYTSGGVFAWSITTNTMTSYLRGGSVAFSSPAYNLYLPPSVYLRMGYDGTTFSAFWSADGVGWVRLGTIAKTFTPLYAGLQCFNSSGGTISPLVDFYRVVTGAGSSGPGAGLFRGVRS